MSQAAPQHRSVLPAEEGSRGQAQLPAPGPVVILPEDSVYVSNGAVRKSFEDAITSAGSSVGPLDENTRGIFWVSTKRDDPPKVAEMLNKYPNIGWVQLPMAGVDAWGDLFKERSDIVWTSAKVSGTDSGLANPQVLCTHFAWLSFTPIQGAYAQPVAEHALALLLALLRVLPKRVRATSWGPPEGLSLFGLKVVIIGAGGIALSLLSLLQPFSPDITIVRRRAETAVPGTTRTIATEDLHNCLPEADVIVIAAALTGPTKHMFSKREFEMMKPTTVLVNVARGELVHTDHLCDALGQGKLGGAGLDVTEPEPLPAEHKLWTLMRPGGESGKNNVESGNGGDRANVIITPHTADTPEMVFPLLAQRLGDNVRALVEQKGKFVGVVDTEHGY